MALTRIRSDCQVWNMFKIWTHAPRASWSSHPLPQTKPNPEICCFTYYGILCSSYYPPSPFFGQKLCGRVFIYSIRSPFTTRLLPVLYAATMIAGKQIFRVWEKPILAFQLRLSVTFVDRLSQSYNKLLFSLKFEDTWLYQTKTTPSSASNLAWDLPPMLQKMSCYSRILSR